MEVAANQNVEVARAAAAWTQLLPEIERSQLLGQLEIAQLVLGLRCNLRCRHCYVHCQLHEAPLTVYEWMDIIRNLWTRGVQSLHLTGGEPLMQEVTLPLLSELSQSFGKTGPHVSLVTNGYCLPRALVQIPQESCHEIIVSIDGDQQQHDQLRGNGTYKRARKAISAILDWGGTSHLRVSCTVHGRNVGSLPSVLSELDRAGVTRVSLHPLVLPVRDAFDDSLLLRSKEFAASINSLARVPQVWSNLRTILVYVPSEYLFPLLESCEVVLRAFEQWCRLGIPEVASSDTQFRFQFHLVCTGFIWQICITPDGYVLPCDRYLGAKDYRPYAAGHALRNDLQQTLITGKCKRLDLQATTVHSSTGEPIYCPGVCMWMHQRTNHPDKNAQRRKAQI
jgi:MoaA/NifB/PqqE/SkfB family radical SAM enzyme